jgi:hypothetical protein
MHLFHVEWKLFHLPFGVRYPLDGDSVMFFATGFMFGHGIASAPSPIVDIFSVENREYNMAVTLERICTVSSVLVAVYTDCQGWEICRSLVFGSGYVTGMMFKCIAPNVLQMVFRRIM